MTDDDTTGGPFRRGDVLADFRAARTPAQRWSALHHGLDPAGFPLVRGWLHGMWWLARPLARAGVPPTAITVAGVALAGTAVAIAPRHPAAASAVVVAAALCDGLDGATAVVGGRATRSGRAADGVADRLADVAFAAVLARLGAPRWSAATAAGLALGVDGLRRVLHTPDRVTVAERPTFTVCAALAGAATAVHPTRLPATASAAVWIGAGGVGIAQLLRGRPDRSGRPRGRRGAGAR